MDKEYDCDKFVIIRRKITMIWKNLSVKRHGDVEEQWTIMGFANITLNGDKHLTI